MTGRRTFLAWFLCALALAAGAAFAVRIGAAEAVWRGDASHVTTAIAVLCILALARTGISSWNGGDVRTVEFGHWASIWSVKLGLIGTAIGISLQADALVKQGSASLGALSTALFTTACGVGASLVIEILTYNLEDRR